MLSMNGVWGLKFPENSLDIQLHFLIKPSKMSQILRHSISFKYILMVFRVDFEGFFILILPMANTSPRVYFRELKSQALEKTFKFYFGLKQSRGGRGEVVSAIITAL